MPPSNFAAPFAQYGVTPAAVASGVFGGGAQTGFLELPITNPDVAVVGAACVGFDYTGPPVWLSIRGFNADEIEVLGRNSNQTDRQTDGTGNAQVGLSAYDDWPFGRYPPYPPEIVKAGMGFGPNFYGSVVGTGSWYMEIYYFVPQPGEGPPTPPEAPRVPCPKRPPWPYKDPAMAATPQGAGRIRRSRP